MSYQQILHSKPDFVQEEKLNEYIDILTGSLIKIQYSLKEYVDYLYLIASIKLIFKRYEDAENILKNLIGNLEMKLNNRILVLKMKSEKDYYEYLYKKVLQLQCFSFFNQDS